MPRHRTTKRTWILVACAVAIIAVVLSVPPIASGLRGLAVGVITFPSRIFSEAWTYLPTKRSLIQQNETLRKKLSGLAIEMQRVSDLKNENDRLRELLNLKKKMDLSTVTAEIIARNPSDWVGSVIIDKGAADGIKKHSAVCSSRGLFGKVVDVDRSSSTVMLLTHPNFKVGGEIYGAGINGVVMGQGKDIVKMIYIPVDAEVKEGAIVTTSGMSRMFPSNIVIGRIISVAKSRTGLYKYAIIRPIADPSQQNEVLCIK